MSQARRRSRSRRSEPRASRSRPVTSISWVTVTVFPNSLAAAVPRTRLEAEGIPTFLDGERMGSLGMYDVATRGVKLQVPANRAAEARIILSQSWSLPTDEKADFEASFDDGLEVIHVRGRLADLSRVRDA